MSYYHEQSAFIENLRGIPYHYGRSSTSSTRAAQTTLSGGIYRTMVDIYFNNILIHATASILGVGSFYIFQNSNGSLGNTSSVPLIADRRGVSIVSGANTIELTQGRVIIRKGFFWILWGGAGAGSWTASTYETQEAFLLNNTVPNDQMPTSFTTALTSGNAVTSLNPTEGGDVNANTANNVPILAIFSNVPDPGDAT